MAEQANPDAGDYWLVMEHRRQLIGGTKHYEYGRYPSEDDAWKAIYNLQRDAEVGVSFSVEHRSSK